MLVVRPPSGIGIEGEPMLHRTPLAGGVPLTPTLLAEREAVVDIIAAVVRHDLFFQKVSALRSPV